MDCKHERLKAIGDRIFCCACNKELPLEFLTDRNANGENRANSTDVDANANKTSSRKRTTKKTV